MRFPWSFWSFARAPLAWSAIIALLFAPFAFIAPIRGDLCKGQDWLWCDDPVLGAVFTATPYAESFLFLLIVPAGLIAALAARIARRGANPRAAWFMAGPLLAFFGVSAALLIQPKLFWLFFPVFWIDVDHSHPGAARLIALHDALPLEGVLTLALALLTLMARSCGAASRSAAPSRIEKLRL